MLEIKRDAALVGVGVDKRHAALGMLDIAGKRRQQSIGITARRFDLDDIGTEIGQLPRRVGSRNIAQLDHPKMTERALLIVHVCQNIASLQK
jgi:hypothetical protein